MQPPADAPDLETTDLETTDLDAADLDSAPVVPAPRTDPDPDEATEAVAPAAEPAGLTEREEQILVFERKWWKHAGSKEQAVRDTFGLSATRYYQLLNGLLDNPAAMEHDPVLIARLRRLRSTRARTRRR
jgi:hypothetical protein